MPGRRDVSGYWPSPSTGRTVLRPCPPARAPGYRRCRSLAQNVPTKAIDEDHLTYPAYDATDGYGTVPRYVAPMRRVSLLTGTSSFGSSFPGAWPLPVCAAAPACCRAEDGRSPSPPSRPPPEPPLGRGDARLNRSLNARAKRSANAIRCQTVIIQTSARPATSDGRVRDVLPAADADARAGMTARRPTGAAMERHRGAVEERAAAGAVFLYTYEPGWDQRGSTSHPR